MVVTLAATSGDSKPDKHSKNIFVLIYHNTLAYEKNSELAALVIWTYFVPGKRTLEKSIIKSA